MRIQASLLRGFRRRARVAEAGEQPAEGAPEPEAAPEAVAESEPVAEPRPVPETESEPMLALAPPPPPEPGPELEPEPAPTVVPLALRDRTPRTWNLWDLERLARELNGDAVSEERTLLLLHMRQFADPSGDLPVEFDPLVREAFGPDLAVLPR